MNLIDFIIGGLLANAMPHLIFGLTNTHFLGLFGYSAKGNIMYALLQFTLCIILLLVNYNFSQLLNNGILIGGLTVLVLYLVFGKFLVKFYQKKQ
jgi:hypothetical protein